MTVDHDRFSTIAHRDCAFLNPLGSVAVAELVQLLRLPPGARVVDFGCGKAELLIQLVETYGAIGTGVDRNPAFVAEARRRAKRRAPGLELHEGDVADFYPEPAGFDAVLCVGATHLFGGYAEALDRLRSLLGLGGLAVVGEGFWRKPVPDPEYLAFLGARAEELHDHGGNQAVAERAGFAVLRSWVTSDADWDRYEEAYLGGVERYALERPDDPEVPEMLRRIRAWHHAYQFWGRDNLGFGLYLLRAV